MKTLYTQEEFNNAKGIDLLPLECEYCGKTFYQPKKSIKYELKHNLGGRRFCSNNCKNIVLIDKITVECKNCDKEIEKTPSQIKRSKYNNHFCSSSCAATYNNKHKTTGTKRSKLEVWLEEQLSNRYNDIEILFNDKTTIGSELDIHIPSLNLAFELNGIFHYEPIYGVDKLQKIQENDKSKSKACHDAKIDLCIIDISGQKYFKPSTSQKYFNIICKIVEERLLTL